MSDVSYQQPAAPTGGKHPVNILHLVMGVVFLGIVSIWALIEGQIATTDDLRWLIPLPWVIAGAAGLIVIMMSRGSEQTAPAAGYEYAARPVPTPDYTSDLEAKLEAEAQPVPVVAPEADRDVAADVDPEVDEEGAPKS